MKYLYPLILLSILVSADSKVFESTLSDQRDLSLTVYNVNLGLVKDVRDIELDIGTNELRFMDVAEKIDPTSVIIKSLSHPTAVTVLEQNYEYDLLSPQKLLSKYVGKELILVTKRLRNNTEVEEEVKAKLLSTNQGLVWQIGNKIITNQPYNRIIYPKLPENLIATPTLVWLLDNQKKDTHKLEVSYLTDGISWKANYVLKLNKDDKKGDISGWVTIDNKSGASYNNAKLKLIAGKVHRVREGVVPRVSTASMEFAGKAPSPFKERAFFEYHLYTLNRRTTLKNNEIKQIGFINADDIPIKKRLIYYGKGNYYRSRYMGIIESNKKIGVYLEIENTKGNNLGIPLPAGVIRVYKEDIDNTLQFIGEDRIDHTPKDEKFKVKMGEAFDVIAERKQTDYRKITDKVIETAFEISIRNHKEQDTEVEVIEPFYGDWEIISSSHKYEKLDAFTLRFTIKVKKNAEEKLNYRVRTIY